LEVSRSRIALSGPQALSVSYVDNSGVRRHQIGTWATRNPQLALAVPSGPPCALTAQGSPAPDTGKLDPASPRTPVAEDSVAAIPPDPGHRIVVPPRTPHGPFPGDPGSPLASCAARAACNAALPSASFHAKASGSGISRCAPYPPHSTTVGVDRRRRSPGCRRRSSHRRPRRCIFRLVRGVEPVAHGLGSKSSRTRHRHASRERCVGP